MSATAGQTHDLVLNGQGYMLYSGQKGQVNYSRKGTRPATGMTTVNTTQNGLESLNGAPVTGQVEGARRLFWNKWTGGGQRFVDDGWQNAQRRGQLNDLAGLRPVLDGATLALVPQSVTAQIDATTAGYASFHSVVLGTTQVVGIDSKIFVSANPGTNSSGFVLKATATGTIVGMCVANGLILINVIGSNVQTFDPVTGIFAAYTPAGSGTLMTAYQGAIILAGNGGTQLYYSAPTITSWVAGPVLESPVTSLTELEGSLYIGTRTGLYRFDGQLKASNPGTAPTTLNQFDYKINLIWRTIPYNGYSNYWAETNFSRMVAWRGSLWFFAGGQLLRATPGASGAPLKIDPQPVYGSSMGLDICAGLLVVVVSNNQVNNQIWANDGNFDLAQGLGWFKLDGGGPYRLPFGNAGNAQGPVNVVNTTGTTYTFTRWLLDPASPVGFKADYYGLPRSQVSGQATLPLFSPADLTTPNEARGLEAVQWLRFGVEWAIIDAGIWWPVINTASVANSYLKLEFSRDGGQTFNTLVFNNQVSLPGAVLTVANFPGNRVQAAYTQPAGQTYPLTRYDGQVTDAGFLLRITWQGTIMPLLRRCWLDYKAVPIATLSGRQWNFELDLSPPVIGLDGQNDSESPKSKYNRLWALWQNGTIFSFSDLDANAIDANDTAYNGSGIYNVRLTGLELKRLSPGQSNLSGPNDTPALEAAYVAGVTLVEAFPE